MSAVVVVEYERSLFQSDSDLNLIARSYSNGFLVYADASNWLQIELRTSALQLIYIFHNSILVVHSHGNDASSNFRYGTKGARL